MPCTFGLQLIAFVAGSDPGTCTMFSFGYTDACIEGKFFEVFSAFSLASEMGSLMLATLFVVSCICLMLQLQL